jgi:hypothetical protein
MVAEVKKLKKKADSGNDGVAPRNRLPVYRADPLLWLGLPSTKRRKPFKLTIGSPPYAYKGKRYNATGEGKGDIMEPESWARWMALLTYAACMQTDGWVIWIVDSPVKGGEYHPAVEMLTSDIYRHHRETIVSERPVLWWKNAAPSRINRSVTDEHGEPTQDWFGHEWEYCLAFRRRNLEPPQFNWKAIAQPPRFEPGGAFRQRGETGIRTLGKPVKKLPLARPRDVITALRSLSEIDILTHYGISKSKRPGQILRSLREAIDTEDLRWWWAGIIAGIHESEVLQSAMQGEIATGGESEERGESSRSQASQSEVEESGLRGMRNNGKAGGSPQGRRRDEQLAGESANTLLDVPQEEAREQRLQRESMRESLLRDGFLCETLPAIQEVRRSVDTAVRQGQAATCGDLIRRLVGGGHMGSPIAHLGEAPFPESLVETFVLSLTEPKDTVFDPFCGSGTVPSVAIKTRRKYCGVDIRQSQVDLTVKRIAEAKQWLKNS